MTGFGKFGIMSLMDRLSSSLGRRDQVPNQKLAKVIATRKDRAAIRELVENLHNNSTPVQYDCINVLYEIGVINPKLISLYVDAFLGLLEHKNNRMQWGGMTALSTIVLECPEKLYKSLARISASADNGSVITRDHAVKIMAALGSLKKYSAKVFPLLNEQLLTAPDNQFPTYAELTAPLVTNKNRDNFIQTLNLRLKDIHQESKRRRVENILTKIIKSHVA